MQVTRMKAVYVNEAHRLEIVDLPKPEITRDDDVLIRITSAGICSSDLEIAAGVHPFARYPMIIGHEFGGIVEQVGAGVTHVAAGDRVTVDPVTSCGKCHSCLQGKPNVCLHLATMGVHRDGGFAEYAVVPEKNVYVFRKLGIDPSILGLAEPYSIGVQTNFRGGTRKGDRVMGRSASAPCRRPAGAGPRWPSPTCWTVVCSGLRRWARITPSTPERPISPHGAKHSTEATARTW